MEIDQYLYDLNESGEAIVAYKMRAANGGSVEICNLSASVLSWSVPTADGGFADIASGGCRRGLRGVEGSDEWGGVRFSQMLWESRVEVNRVVMSLSWECDGVGVMSEVVFDYDDDNTLEITYIACPDSPCELDLTHKLTFNLGGDARVNIISDKAVEEAESIYHIRGAERSILKSVANVEGDLCSIDLLSSHPALHYSGDTLATLCAPTEVVDADTRYVQKTLFKIK